MKRMMLGLALLCALCFIGESAFATNWGDTNNYYDYDYDYNITNQGGHGGAGGSVTNNNTNKQKQDQSQGQAQGQIQGQKQGQGQGQDQSQFGYVDIDTPRPFPNSPALVYPEINFGSGKMFDITNNMPNFLIWGIKKYNREAIIDTVVVKVVSFKDLFITVKDEARGVSKLPDFRSSNYKLMIVVTEAQFTWTFGLNLGAMGTGLGTSAGGSGGASFGPAWGRTKADPEFTVVFVKVDDGK